jgi:hypothetical protein
MKIIPILTLLFMVLVTMVRGAVTVTTITSTDFNSLVSTHQAAWSVMYLGGATSGGNSEEIRLARNLAIPQAGGGTNTLTGQLVWSSTNNTMGVTLDGAGNISASANSTHVFSSGFTVVRPYNQILIMVLDQVGFGSSNSLFDIKVNNQNIRNMFADGSGSNPVSDIVSITDFGTQTPFDFLATWSPGTFPAGDQQYVHIVALQNPTIPEPSVPILIAVASIFAFRRQR